MKDKLIGIGLGLIFGLAICLVLTACDTTTVVPTPEHCAREGMEYVEELRQTTVYVHGKYQMVSVTIPLCVEVEDE